MIDFVKGEVNYIAEEFIVLDNNGIGYKIYTSSFTTGRVKLHDEITMYTHMNVREDDISLFGFLSRDEVTTFRLLITVSGVGPKVALAILSCLTMDELRMAIISEDHKAISKANGVGTKTAQRVVMDLKDKFKLEDVFDSMQDTSDSNYVENNDNITEVAMALTSLGYSNVEALSAIKKVPSYETMSVEDLLKAALKKIM